MKRLVQYFLATIGLCFGYSKADILGPTAFE